MPRPTSSYGKAGETTIKQNKKRTKCYTGVKVVPFQWPRLKDVPENFAFIKYLSTTLEKKIADRCLNRILQWRTAKYSHSCLSYIPASKSGAFSMA